jgi:hypothetical protein
MLDVSSCFDIVQEHGDVHELLIQKGEFSVIVGECSPVVSKIVHYTVWLSSHPFPYRPAFQNDESY